MVHVFTHLCGFHFRPHPRDYTCSLTEAMWSMSVEYPQTKHKRLSMNIMNMNIVQGRTIAQVVEASVNINRPSQGYTHLEGLP